MDAGTWRGLFTLFMFIAFLGICWWAWSSRRKDDFEAAANLPLQDDDFTDSSGSTESKTPTIQDGARQQ